MGLWELVAMNSSPSKKPVNVQLLRTYVKYSIWRTGAALGRRQCRTVGWSSARNPMEPVCDGTELLRSLPSVRLPADQVYKFCPRSNGHRAGFCARQTSTLVCLRESTLH